MGVRRWKTFRSLLCSCRRGILHIIIAHARLLLSECLTEKDPGIEATPYTCSKRESYRSHGTLWRHSRPNEIKHDTASTDSGLHRWLRWQRCKHMLPVQQCTWMGVGLV